VNTTNRSKHAASPARYVIAAVLAAIAGFGTVYWSLAPSDNGGTPVPGGQEQPATAGGNTGESPLDGLNTGGMTAFLVRSEPLDLPDFTFEGADGAEESLADLRGKVVLLNIWATWCVPCREEMPQLNALQADLGGEDFEVVAINIDRGGADKARKFLEEIEASDLARYTDPSGKLFVTLKAVGMPTTLLIDRDGKEIGRLVGPADWASAEAKTLIEAAISAGAQTSGS
jgi:thiol-disulfide isomerase/thioredoxin